MYIKIGEDRQTSKGLEVMLDWNTSLNLSQPPIEIWMKIFQDGVEIARVKISYVSRFCVNFKGFCCHSLNSFTLNFQSSYFIPAGLLNSSTFWVSNDNTH